MNTRKRVCTVIIISLLFGSFSCARSLPTGIQTDGTSLKSDLVGDPRLVEILNFGIPLDLNHQPPGPDEDLRLKLYAIPKEGNCLPDSHYVCSRHYYLAASSFEEGFASAVYDLGEVGEISDIQWLKSDHQQTARLHLRVTNYPVEYFKVHKLTRKEQAYELEVGLDRLTVKLSQ